MVEQTTLIAGDNNNSSTTVRRRLGQPSTAMSMMEQIISDLENDPSRANAVVHVVPLSSVQSWPLTTGSNIRTTDCSRCSSWSQPAATAAFRQCCSCEGVRCLANCPRNVRQRLNNDIPTLIPCDEDEVNKPLSNTLSPMPSLSSFMSRQSSALTSQESCGSASNFSLCEDMQPVAGLSLNDLLRSSLEKSVLPTNNGSPASSSSELLLQSDNARRASPPPIVPRSVSAPLFGSRYSSVTDLCSDDGEEDEDEDEHPGRLMNVMVRSRLADQAPQRPSRRSSLTNSTTTTTAIDHEAAIRAAFKSSGRSARSRRRDTAQQRPREQAMPRGPNPTLAQLPAVPPPRQPRRQIS